MTSLSFLHREKTFTIPTFQNDEQMQFISKRSRTFGFSLPGSISGFSLHFPGVYLHFGRNAINFMDKNFTELQRLCEGLDFSEISAKFSEFCPSMDFKETEAEEQIHMDELQ
jgi:hypothetical protein